MLRVVPEASWQPENVSDPVGPILVMLAATIGIPYFVLSSTGPLLQAWFVRSFPGRIPYRLYALSNIGSLLGAGELSVLLRAAIRSRSAGDVLVVRLLASSRLVRDHGRRVCGCCFAATTARSPIRIAACDARVQRHRQAG